MTISLPYIAYVIFLCALMVLEFHYLSINKNTRLIRQLAIVSFVLFFGLRYFVGFDISMYYNSFISLPNLPNLNSKSLFDNFEIGWTIYTIICKTILVKFEVFIFFNTLLDAILLHHFLSRYSKYYIFGLIVFLAYYGLVLELEQLRNAKAILIFANSIKYLENKNYFKYICLNLIGVTFHLSAILYILFLPFINKKTSKVTDLLFFIVPLFVFCFNIKWLYGLMTIVSNMSSLRIHEKMIEYMHDDFISGGQLHVSFTLIENIIMYVLCIFIMDRKLEKTFNSYHHIFKNMFILYFAIYILFFEISVMSIRTSTLFVITYPILLSELLFTLKNKSNKLILVLVISAFSLKKIYTNTYNPVYIYETIFRHSHTIKEKQQNIAIENNKKSSTYKK